MDGFSYYNIFETKGIEYLAIIAFFLFLIPFWMVLNKPLKLVTQMRASIGHITASALKFPRGLFYSKNHTWTHLESSGNAKIGLDDLLLHIIGDVKFSKLKKSGDKISKGDLIAEIHNNNRQLNLYSPISGEIMSTNSMLSNNPALVNIDPYQKGWLYKIKPADWKAETNSYYLGDEAVSWSVNEVERFKDFLTAAVAKYSHDPSQVILQDGGEVVDHALSEMPNEVWRDFQESFLTTP